MKRTPFNLPHLDAAENIFFQRELETILAEQFNVVYATLKGRMLIPTGPLGVDPWAETYTYDQYDSKGKAKHIADAADDFPMVKPTGLQFNNKVQMYGDAFGYSVQELQAAAAKNKPLDRTLAMIARDTIEQQVDALAFSGDTANGLKGITTLSNTLTQSPGTKASGSATNTTGWLDSSGNVVATADEMLSDLHQAYIKPVTSTLEVERPTRILLPTAQHAAAQKTPRSSISNTTVLEFFRATHENCEVMSWERLKGAGPANGYDLMIAYEPNPRKIRHVLPVDFTQQAPQLRNLKYIVNCYVRSGGVIAPYPQSICLCEGI
jgi:hypothetical protein